MANQDFRVKNGLQVGLGASVVGIVTAESFSGSAVGLTNVPSASLTGTISSERLSGTYDIDILGTVSGDSINIKTATVTEQLNVGAGDTGVFATATDGTLSVSGVSTFSGDLTVGTATTGSVVRTDGTLNVSGIATFKDRVIFDSTNSVQIPVGTEAEKDAVGTAVTGQIRYNTTNSQFEGFGPGNDWGSLGGVKDVDGDTYVKPESSPGSDEDALTFFTGGTERAVIDSDGKVGIGSTQPTSTLDLDGTLNVSGISTFKDRVIFDSTNSIQIPVGTTADRDAVGTAVTGQIRYNTTLSSFEGYGPGGEWGTLGGVKDIDQDTYITAQKDLAVDDDALRFYTNGTEQVSIDSTGKVGIGSTQPTAKLDVSGDIVSSGNLLPLTDNTGVVGNASYTWSNGQFTNLTIDSTLNVRAAIDLADNDILRFGSSDDVKVFYDGTNNDLEIELESDATQIAITDNGTYKHIITKDGKVGINTSVTPSSELEVYGNIKLTGAIYGSTELIIDPMPIGVGTTSGIVRIKGDLYVDGTTTQINSTSLEIADFIVGIASTATTDLLADGAGIKIGPDNTFLYEYNSGTNPSLKSSENLNVASGKVYQIGETERLSANTLSLGTGTTIHSPSSNVLSLGVNGKSNIRVENTGDVTLNLSSTSNDEGVLKFGRQDEVARDHFIRVYPGSTGASSYMKFDVHDGVPGSSKNVLTLLGDGNVGINTADPQYKLHVIGSFAATTKSFVIDHPTKEGMKLRYGSLESPYHGIRLTGSSTIKNGKCIIELPDYIHNLVKEEGINIHITNIRHGKVLWVEEVNVAENNFVVMTEETEGEYEFYWDFTAIRKDVEDMIVEF